MMRLSSVLFLAAAGLLVQAQETPKQSSDLPTACEIRAYYLDKDGKPADTSDVKAALIFETQDGKTRTYPMTLTPADQEKPAVPRCRFLTIEKSPYRMAAGAFCTDASVPGGHTHYGKTFLRPLPVHIEPEPKENPDKRDAALVGAPYFKALLNEQAISDLASVPFTDASIQWSVRGDVYKVHCFTCSNGAPGTPCDRVQEELSILERQLQAKDFDGAKGTMTRLHDSLDALPSTKANETAKKEAAVCCKDLDNAVQAGNRDKALAEVRKLREKCDKCEECIDPQDKDSRRDHKK